MITQPWTREPVDSLPLVSAEEVALRVERTRSCMAESGLDVLLVVGRSFYDRCGNLAYLSNHLPPFPSSTVVGDMRGFGHAFLILPLHEPPTLVLDLPSYRAEYVAVKHVQADWNMPKAVAGVLHERGLERAAIGVVGEDIMPLVLFRDLQSLLPQARFRSADSLVTAQRKIKSASELRLLRCAALVADASLQAVLAGVKPGVSERELSAVGIAAGMRAGADFVRYIRVHSGPLSAWGTRWPPATDRRLSTGDLVTVDAIGARSAYQFDVLRTTVAGTPSAEQLRMLDAMLRANEKVVGAVRPGVAVRELVLLGLAEVEAAGYGNHASRFIGHGIGLETAEEPFLTLASEETLEAGMVICIEPGVYIPNWGGCSVEQEVFVTEDGYEIITPTPVRNW